MEYFPKNITLQADAQPSRQWQEGVSDALQYIGLCMNNSVTDPSEMQLEQGLYYLAPDFPLGT